MKGRRPGPLDDGRGLKKNPVRPDGRDAIRSAVRTGKGPRGSASLPAGLAQRRAAGQRSPITDRKAKIGEAHARDSHSSDRRPGGPEPRGGRTADAGQGRGQAAPARGRRQLHRRLSAHRLLSAGEPAVHAGQRGRGRGRRGRAVGGGVQARRPRRLRRIERAPTPRSATSRRGSSSSCRERSPTRRARR